MDQNALFGAIALIALAVFGYTRMFLSGKSTGKLKGILPEARIIDVRTSGEYREGHLSNAINIPVDKLAKSGKKLGSQDEPIIVYCASGSRAKQAARLLKGMGFQSVYVGGSFANMKKLSA